MIFEEDDVVFTWPDDLVPAPPSDQDPDEGMTPSQEWTDDSVMALSNSMTAPPSVPSPPPYQGRAHRIAAEIDEPAMSISLRAPNPTILLPAPAPQQASLPVSPVGPEMSAATAGFPRAAPELTPPGLTPAQQENFRRIWETCLSSVASQTAAEADAALLRVLAAAWQSLPIRHAPRLQSLFRASSLDSTCPQQSQQSHDPRARCQ